MTDLHSTYAKPFLIIPEQVRRLRERGMDCGDDAYAAQILERYGYYRLSGYWHIYRDRPVPPARQFSDDGREIRLDTFTCGTSLAHVVALYEFDHELRTRVGDVLSMIENAFRFFIGHRLGRVDKFAHRKPEALGAVHDGIVSTSTCKEWIKEYDRQEKRAKGDFIRHFREKYGPHLPIWVATEVMSFGVLSRLYRLMGQHDQEILAARFQIHTKDGGGDYGALANWLNSLRQVRNICAHYGRVWNRTFDVTIQAPGRAQKSEEDLLAPLAVNTINNRFYGVLLVMRHLMLSIDPSNVDVVELADYVEKRTRELDLSITQLGFPDDWKNNPIWGRTFTLSRSPMLAASLLDRTESLTASKVPDVLTAAEPEVTSESLTPKQLKNAMDKAQKELLRTYRRHQVVIEIELGGTKFYPVFQFRDGKIIDALADINQKLTRSCGDVGRTEVAKALLGWWQTPHVSSLRGETVEYRSPLDLLHERSEKDFEEIIENGNALSRFVAPG